MKFCEDCGSKMKKLDSSLTREMSFGWNAGLNSPNRSGLAPLIGVTIGLFRRTFGDRYECPGCGRSKMFY